MTIAKISPHCILNCQDELGARHKAKQKATAFKTFKKWSTTKAFLLKQGYITSLFSKVFLDDLAHISTKMVRTGINKGGLP